MERIERKFALTTFKRCQLCGYVSKNDDICAFRMLNECDDKDIPEEGNVIVVCTSKLCNKIIDDHPRLYVQVPWGKGKPGYFMLAGCSDCKYRDNASCTHPDLISNGGRGLQVMYSKPIFDVHVSFSNGKGGRHTIGDVFTDCKGRELGVPKV